MDWGFIVQVTFALDSFCCESEWDELCARLANDKPACSSGCFAPNAIASVGRVESVGSASASGPSDARALEPGR